MSKNILILGSSGQIGSYLVNYLEKKKYDVKTFDILNGKQFDLRHKNFLLDKLVKNSNYIFFLAFDVGGSRYLNKYQNTFQFINNNLKIMTNTFEVLNKYNKKFLFVSSQMSNMLYSNYGILKLIGEKVTKTLNGNYIKLWNVYGIEQDLKKSHVITDFIRMATKKKKITMRTNGMETRDFLYVEDCCNGLEIIMKKHNKFLKQNKELHLTSGKNIKIIQIAKIIKKIAKKKGINIKIKPSKQSDLVQQNKKNKFNRYILNFWKPKTDIYSGIEKIFDYQQRN